MKKLSLAIGFILAVTTTNASGEGLPAWDFDTASATEEWVPNAHITNVQLKNGILSFHTIDGDAFFVCKGIRFKATPWQYLLLRIKADRPGTGDLFWSGTEEGKYGGFSEEKKTGFQVCGDVSWEEIAIFPFWQSEGDIIQLRLDLYEGAHFEIDSIHILSWGEGKEPITDTFAWRFAGDLSPWKIQSQSSRFFSPPLRLSVADKNWISIRLRSEVEGSASVLWSTANSRGAQSEEFRLRGDGRFHNHNLEMSGIPTWQGPLVAFGIQLPRGAEGKVFVDSVEIVDGPQGPPQVDVDYFGFENGVNRAGLPCPVIAQVANRGGTAAESLGLRLELSSALRLTQGEERRTIKDLDIESKDLARWEIVCERPGTHSVSLVTDSSGTHPVTADLRFEPKIDIPKADYVPPPRPIQTDIDVCMYYFPGWDTDAKWDCIRGTAPIRKPLLGYYDEANPECVDWQIKWAVENGIACFLVDWYWIKGSQHLTHWFEAYRKSRYRNDLKVAIMWANHNPPGSHSVDDFRKVTQHWIDDYFSLEPYYRIDGKPAVFLWDPHLIRSDLGGVEAVREVLQESQKMAREAGYDGISFIAMHQHDSSTQVENLLEEGYCGATNYHEWGDAFAMGGSDRLARYADLVASVPEKWAKRDDTCGKLTYYPVVDTGWDSRPWHGNKALVIEGRTPDLFERLLLEAKRFCEGRDKPIVVLAPANEWGEGSYVEPCTEFGFEMYERIRKVFGKGDPAKWPVNIAPRDVGLGPYDFRPRPLVTTWTFEEDPGGWKDMMNVADLKLESGRLKFKTTSRDPAIVVDTPGLRAIEYPRMLIRMRLARGVARAGNGQLFWSKGGSATSEAASVRFPLKADGEFHDYTLDLAANSRWRGPIGMIRLDPCDAQDVEVEIEEIRLVRD